MKPLVVVNIFDKIGDSPYSQSEKMQIIRLVEESPLSVKPNYLRSQLLLNRLFKNLTLRYAMIYQKEAGQDPSEEPLLISMKIVPEGKENNPDLNFASVVDVNGEAVIRSLSLSRPPRREGQTPPAVFGYAEQRWQARLNKMPEEKRTRIEEDMKQRQVKRAARTEEVENRRAEQKKKVAEHRAKRQTAEEELRASNPDLYELRKQQREGIRQLVVEDLMQ